MSPELIGRSSTTTRVQEVVRRAAASDSSVLLTGEAGVDVASVARELHERSRGEAAPFLMVDCGSGEAATVERLLFGASADAASDLEAVTVESCISAARGGTLFLHGIGELPAAAQARLARVVRDGEVRIDGAPSATGFRIVASASPGIDADVQAHRFRADLFRRISAVRIDLPPLRERAEDVPAVAARLLDEACAAAHRAPRTFTQAASALIGALTWSGNVAELRDVIARVVATTRDTVVQVEQVLPALQLNTVPAAFAPAGNLREARLRFERDYIAAVLQHHGWRMADAAHTLGIQRPNLYRKARQLGIPLTRMSE